MTVLEGSEYRNGDEIRFGRYPQTEVKDAALCAALCAAAGELPTGANARKWTEYPYYIGGKLSKFMWYVDVDRGGERYRGVYFTKYRPYRTELPGGKGNGNQPSNGYVAGTVYWFRFEPIVWRVLERRDGAALVMSAFILDSLQFSHRRRAICGENGERIYPNNYAQSEIRKFLLGDFSRTAFRDGEKELLMPVRVENGLDSTGDCANRFVCEDTEDAVFLLSCREIMTQKYGFSDDCNDFYDPARLLDATDYAMALGVSAGESGLPEREPRVGWWWLRSPDYFGKNSAYCVTDTGNVFDCDEFSVTNAQGGVVPALCLRLGGRAPR